MSRPRRAPVELVRGFRLGLVVVVGVAGVFRLASARTEPPAPGWAEHAYTVVAVVAVALVGVTALRRRTLDPRVLPGLLVVALVLDLLVAVRLGPAGVGATRDWTLANVGWLGFFAVADGPRRRLVAVLLAPFVVRVAVVLAGGAVGALREVGSLAIGLVVLQLGCAMFMSALGEQARVARAAQAERARLDAARLAAEALQADFRARSAALGASTLPLLRELADGTASPADEATRQRARVESARLRRLFAEADVGDDTLLAEVRAVVEQVERRGVSTVLHCPTAPPVLPATTQRALLDAPMATLALAESYARVVVQVLGDELVVSVTTDGPAAAAGPAPDPGDPGATAPPDPAVTATTETVEDLTWTQSTWTRPPAPHPTPARP